MPTQIAKIVVPERQFAQASRSTLEAATAGRLERTVRRPVRGITIRDDTFATMRLVAGNGKNQKLIDAGGRPRTAKGTDYLTVEVNGREMRATDVYSNFLIQGILEDRQEKAQILETFGEPYIFLFGERPRILNIQGVLLNTWDFNWEAEWWANYDNFLRGTKCVENDARVYLSFDNTLVGGYIVSSNAQKQTGDRNHLQFSFQLFLTYYESFSNLGDSSVLPGSSKVAREVEVTDAAFRIGGPDQVYDSASTYYVDANGEAHPQETASQRRTSLQTALSASPTTLAESWKKVQSDLRGVLDTVSQIASGQVVRVPFGFEGSFAYDETVYVKEKKTQGALTFTTFDRNDDEYIGSSDHYGSSTSLKRDPSYSSLTVNGLGYEVGQGQSTFDQAKNFWKSMKVETNKDAEKLAKAVQIAQLGCIAFNVAKGIVSVARTGMNEAVPDFTNTFSVGVITGGSLPRGSGAAQE